MLAAEISDCGRGAGVCRGEANCIAVPHGVNQIAPPPAETHDGCSNGRVGHAVTDGFEILLIPDADTGLAGLVRPSTTCREGRGKTWMGAPGSWRVPAGGSPVQVRGSARLVASVA